MNEKIWESVVIDNHELEMFDSDILHSVEKRLKLKLPQEYVDLMKTRNGGSLARKIFKLNKDEIFIEYILGIGGSEDEGVLTTIYMSKEWGLPRDIVLLSGNGHTWVFLDYRKDKENPSVSYIDKETDLDLIIASNFTDFINKLSFDSSSNDNVEYVSENVYSIKEFEKIVKEGNDAYLITDGFLYFTEIDCDMEWLLSQTVLIMDIETEESEFILPEVLYYLMNKIIGLKIIDQEKMLLRFLADKVKDHNLYDVRKYYKKILHLL